jgi:FAD:protein FMN transferase
MPLWRNTSRRLTPRRKNDFGITLPLSHYTFVKLTRLSLVVGFAAVVWQEQLAAAHLERLQEAMGTTFVVEMYGSDEASLNRAADEALNEAQRVDRMLSNYIPESELSGVNENAAAAPVKVSRELFNLLVRCIDYSRASEGSFDITVGPVMKVWGFYKGSGHMPGASEIRVALEKVGYGNIELDQRAMTVRFRKAGMALDPGGVGKGYAVDRMADILRKRGITSALISAGGSSIYGMGSPPNEARGWYIRIRDPRDEHKTAADIFLKDISLSTSGSYEKFFWAEGKVHSHIMDPRTGSPAEGMLSVSVISPFALDSEVWAKPYYILGREWTEKHKPRDFRVLMCEDKAVAGCGWVQ